MIDVQAKIRKIGHCAALGPDAAAGELENPVFILILAFRIPINVVMLNFLFPEKNDAPGASWLLLVARVVFGVLLMSHGIAKCLNFDTLAATFPDPLGVGSRVSLMMAIFGEVVCPAGFIAGLLYRLALIPMIFTMCVAFFAVHGGDPFAARELALVYLAVFVLMYIAGPGRYAADTLIARYIPRRLR